MATSAQIKSFIYKFGELAVAECNRRIALGEGFVLPSVCMAQSAIETGWGTAGIMVKANAYFGIKAGGSWTGAVYRADTWEVDSGGAYNTTANFRAYSSPADSVRDYFDLILKLPRYSKAISYTADRSKWLTPRECITAIWAGGYATDTLYVEKVMNTINARNLTEWDKLITGAYESTVLPFVEYTADKFTAGYYTVDSLRDGDSVINTASHKISITLKAGTHKIVFNGLGDQDYVTLIYKEGSNYYVDLGTVTNPYYLTLAESSTVYVSVMTEQIAPGEATIKSMTTAKLPAEASISYSPLAYFVKVQ